MNATNISKNIAGSGKPIAKIPSNALTNISPANIFAKSLKDKLNGLVTISNKSTRRVIIPAKKIRAK